MEEDDLPEINDTFLTPDEVASMYSLSEYELMNLHGLGSFPFIKIGKTLRFGPLSKMPKSVGCAARLELASKR